MDAAPAIASPSYRRRLRREAIAGRAGDLLSLFSPRLRRRHLPEPRRIGVFAQWGIGDAVLLLPLLRGLKDACPPASLELIGKPWLAELFAGEGCCDRTHLLVPPWTAYVNKYRPPAGVWAGYRTQLKALRRGRFDWLIAPRFDVREVLQLRLARTAESFGFGAAGGRFWITRDVGLDRAAHDRLHRAGLAAAVLQAIVPGGRPGSARFCIDSAGQEAGRTWLAAQGYRSGPILAVHSGGGNPLRHWHEPWFETVLRALPVPPALTVLIAAEPMQRPPGPLPGRHAVWQGNLTGLKALLSLCEVFLGTDSGVMHMAAAAGCRVVAAFGPTEPLWFGPYGDGHEIAIVEPMPCRPCYDACIYPSPRCLDQFDDRWLTAAVARKLQEWRHRPDLADPA